MVRVVVVSDTHNGHRMLDIPDGDIFIHCGDMTNRGSAPELADVNAWLEELPHLHKLVICGNMDQRLESLKDRNARARFFPNCIYLEDEAVEIAGLHVYGSPFTPKFCGSFQLADQHEADQKWSSIPEGLDILVTHGPPKGVLDVVDRDTHVGCPQLMRRIQVAQPQYHCFGHIHEEGGKQATYGRTTFVNAAQNIMVLDIIPRHESGSVRKVARKSGETTQK